MSWNVMMDSYYNPSYSSYNDSTGSFIDFFAGLTYDHVNFIFAGSPMQDTTYSSLDMGYYKYGYTEPVVTQHYSYSRSYEAYDNVVGVDEYSSRPSEFTSSNIGEQTTTIYQQSERMPITNVTTRNRDCPRIHHNSRDYHQVVWEDNVDPDNMTYEELLELGEGVGRESRGLSQEQISQLPVSKYKFFFFTRKKSQCERCVICQMAYKRGDRQVTLPCKHKYHVDCGSKWLGINKACPVCYTEVSVGATKKVAD